MIELIFRCEGGPRTLNQRLKGWRRVVSWFDDASYADDVLAVGIHAAAIGIIFRCSLAGTSRQGTRAGTDLAERLLKLARSNLCGATVDKQLDARYKTGVARGQKERGGGDLFRAPNGSPRNERDELVYGFLTERL